MSFQEELKKVIPASNELRESMERLWESPPPSPEKMEQQIQASLKLRRSPEYKALRTKENWAKFVESSRKRKGV